MKRFLLAVLVIIIIMQPVVSQAQITNPNIPRSWWNSVKDYIDLKAEFLTWSVQSSFTGKILENSGTKGDTLTVFTPQAASRLQSVSVWLSVNNTPDSTLYLILLHGSSDTLVTIDSSGSGIETYFESTKTYNYTAAERCSLIFLSGSDSVNIGRAVVTLQVKNR